MGAGQEGAGPEAGAARSLATGAAGDVTGWRWQQSIPLPAVQAGRAAYLLLPGAG